MEDKAKIPKPLLWTGRILKGILTLFLLFDAVTKIIKERHVMESSVPLGLPASSIPVLGFYLLIATIFYAIPRTSVTGAILITAYLGGATAVTFVSKIDGHPFLFSVIFGLIIWVAEWLQNQRLKNIFPIVK